MKDHPDQLDLEVYCNRAEATLKISDAERRHYKRGWNDRRAGRANNPKGEMMYTHGYLDARWLDAPDPAGAYCRMNDLRIAV